MKIKTRKVVELLTTIVVVVASVITITAEGSLNPAQNTLTYNAKNAVTSGTYAEPAPQDDDHYFAGWATTKEKADAGNADFNPKPEDLSNKSLNEMKAGKKNTVYAVYKERKKIYYAVSPYGIGVDQVEEGETAGITFGPATGNMFSEYTNKSSVSGKYAPHVNAHQISDSTYLINDNSITTAATTDGTATDGNGNYVAVGTSAPAGRTTVTNAMMQADMDAVQPENEPALTDNGSHAIVGDDAGVDGKGNAYRCIHYDNWNTILYWNNKDPKVYDKCVKNHCSKKLEIKTIDSSDSYTNGFNFQNIKNKNDVVGDGSMYIAWAIWDDSYNPSDYSTNKSEYMYKKSEIRAKLIGSDSEMRRTRIDSSSSGGNPVEKYNLAFYDSLSEDRKSYLAAFPSQLRNQMASKVLYDTEDASKADKNEDSYADKLWLLNDKEMLGNDTIYKDRFAGNYQYSSNSSLRYGCRGNDYGFWLRSRYGSNSADNVYGDGDGSGSGVNGYSAVCPCFVLATTYVDSPKS